MTSPTPQPKKQSDIILRGQTHSSPLGYAVFVGLRALDPILQYGILANGLGAPLLRAVGLNTIADGPAIHTGVEFIDALGLSPYRLALLALATGSAVKQVFWLFYINKETVTTGVALSVAFFNSLVNSLGSLLAVSTLAASPSGTIIQPNVLLGLGLYVGGILTETLAEVQRKFFKEDPRNQGKVCTTGFWSVTRHINYTGYVAWRIGYALVGGGWPAGALIGAQNIWSFKTRGIPSLDEYATKRYGEQWAQYKRQTPFKLIPGIW